MKKTIAIIILCFALTLSFAGCKSISLISGADGPTAIFITDQNSSDADTPSEKIFQATVTQVDHNAMLVTPVKNSSELNSSDCFSIPLTNIESSEELKVGDSVEISYDGTICETYPATLGKVIKIRILSKTEHEN